MARIIPLRREVDTMVKKTKNKNPCQNANVIVEQKDIPWIITVFYWIIIVPAVIFFCEIEYAPNWLISGFYFMALFISLHYCQKSLNHRVAQLLEYGLVIIAVFGPGFVFSVSTNQPWVQKAYQFLAG